MRRDALTVDRKVGLGSAHDPSEQKKGVAPCSWTPEESQVESCEHQDNANIHCQPFPESVSEEREIHTDYDGCHCHHVKRDSDLPAHFSSHGLYRKGRGECPEGRPCFGWVLRPANGSGWNSKALG
jgi:hypothetical protein